MPCKIQSLFYFMKLLVVFNTWPLSTLLMRTAVRIKRIQYCVVRIQLSFLSSGLTSSPVPGVRMWRLAVVLWYSSLWQFLFFCFSLVLKNECNALFQSYFPVILTLILTDSGRAVLDCRHAAFFCVSFQQSIDSQMPGEAWLCGKWGIYHLIPHSLNLSQAL